MSTAISVLAILAIGYIIGSIPTAQIMMRLFRKQDLRQVGTGSVTSMIVAGSTYNMQLLWVLLLSCIFLCAWN